MRKVTQTDSKNEIALPAQKLAAVFKDAEGSAELVNLIYVSDSEPGITREKEGADFVYVFKYREIKDKTVLKRIRSLVLPPAWENVWICANPDGHLQATGIDAMGRKQYRYHAMWNTVRNETKFHHLYEFGKVLPQIRERLHKDLSLPGLPMEKVLATIVSLMQCTCIRIGSNAYEKLYGSYGRTTLKDKHVSFSGATMEFKFKGKKGVLHDISMHNKHLAHIVKQCQDIPGKELFQFLDADGKHHKVESGMVNNYIKEVSGGEFTAKDFRTWAGSLHAIEAFMELGDAKTESGLKKNVVAALDKVAEHLGNTRMVCKKYYVHPIVIDHYMNKTIKKYLAKAEKNKDCDTSSLLSAEEQLLMEMIK